MTEDPGRIGPVIDPLEAARDALLMIRQTVEMLALPDTLPPRGQTGIEMCEEAEAICRAIRAIAERQAPHGETEIVTPGMKPQDDGSGMAFTPLDHDEMMMPTAVRVTDSAGRWVEYVVATDGAGNFVRLRTE